MTSSASRYNISEFDSCVRTDHLRGVLLTFKSQSFISVKFDVCGSTDCSVHTSLVFTSVGLIKDREQATKTNYYTNSSPTVCFFLSLHCTVIITGVLNLYVYYRCRFIQLHLIMLYTNCTWNQLLNMKCELQGKAYFTSQFV